ncbi:1-(5-phosphoribosyl)-5-[(5-phosphoribosylamino)methylideneamino] imidazole-4-carboxamide isomerase, chloroplastic-like [Arachis stenosperma]|uniref:1-(5-phosphoribosyl)-5-[(5- phosphoribosylamino)methylideneamino] imidazole-4-carboxamide isomerase, chloroplastic-like n=1 Tax=Arachis stenosperma TaxID=217475 RepID=UPI0025AC72CD|nr:1-(5-phosphoribosyl)-5-[(5-phosphoribosylamino)methylideneamino] imidazole-4-carboxamide isomerase, chloroplastic-like [Arachis stenosperma]
MKEQESPSMDQETPSTTKTHVSNNTKIQHDVAMAEDHNSNNNNVREKLKRHKISMAGRVWIPETWGQEELLKDWIDCTSFEAPLVPSRIMMAKAALVQEGRRTSSAGLTIQNSSTNHLRFLQPSRSATSTFSNSIQCAVRFRPCIDIHKGKVKQIVGSTLQDLKGDGSNPVTNFESDKSAAEYAILYKQDGLTGGHAIMLGADPLSKAAALEALHAYPGGLQVGGGINSDNCLSYIEEGASHVIVTSYVFNNGQMDLKRLKDLVRIVGKERLVLDLSCRKKEGKYAIVTDRWQKFSDVSLDAEVMQFLANFADEFLVHGVDVEGKKLGIDEELVALLGKHSPIPVTYAGGVTVMDDLERIKTAGMERVDVTVGSALDIFGGNMAYKDVVAWHTQQQASIV